MGPGSSGCGTGSGVSKALGSLTQFELPEETARETQPSVTVAGALSRWVHLQCMRAGSPLMDTTSWSVLGLPGSIGDLLGD